MHVCTLTHSYLCRNTHKHMLTYTYTLTYTHTHTHTYACAHTHARTHTVFRCNFPSVLATQLCAFTNLCIIPFIGKASQCTTWWLVESKWMLVSFSVYVNYVTVCATVYMVLSLWDDFLILLFIYFFVVLILVAIVVSPGGGGDRGFVNF